jgi:hypothetical protein
MDHMLHILRWLWISRETMDVLRQRGISIVWWACIQLFIALLACFAHRQSSEVYFIHCSFVLHVLHTRTPMKCSTAASSTTNKCPAWNNAMRLIARLWCCSVAESKTTVVRTIDRPILRYRLMHSLYICRNPMRWANGWQCFLMLGWKTLSLLLLLMIDWLIDGWIV